MANAIVVGGTSGIGQAIIHGLIEAGYDVKFTYNSNKLVANEICARHSGRCTAAWLDLTLLDEVSAFLNDIGSTEIPEILVNSAGALHDALSLGDIRCNLEQVTTINYMAPAMIASHIAKLMSNIRRGAIVNITSIASRRPKIGNAVYGSAKAALERFTATLALEVARFKVRTLCVSPGFVDTPMFHKFAGSNHKEIVKNIPMREILSPDEVAEAVIQFVQGKIRTTGTTLVLGNGELVF